MSNKERLENMSPIGFDLNGNVLLRSEDYYWLMEQAERVEEIEKDLEEWQNEAIRLFKLFEESQELNKRYYEALKFYADDKSWEFDWLDDIRESLIWKDYGEKARQALEGTE